MSTIDYGKLAYLRLNEIIGEIKRSTATSYSYNTLTFSGACARVSEYKKNFFFNSFSERNTKIYLTVTVSAACSVKISLNGIESDSRTITGSATYSIKNALIIEGENTISVAINSASVFSVTQLDIELSGEIDYIDSSEFLGVVNLNNKSIMLFLVDFTMHLYEWNGETYNRILMIKGVNKACITGDSQGGVVVAIVNSSSAAYCFHIDLDNIGITESTLLSKGAEDVGVALLSGETFLFSSESAQLKISVEKEGLLSTLVKKINNVNNVFVEQNDGVFYLILKDGKERNKLVRTNRLKGLHDNDSFTFSAEVSYE